MPPAVSQPQSKNPNTLVAARAGKPMLPQLQQSRSQGRLTFVLNCGSQNQFLLADNKTIRVNPSHQIDFYLREFSL